jgi:hypothetical protein
MEIFRRYYDFIRDQNTIKELDDILKWFADKGFELKYFARPQSSNLRYPDVEFVMQRGLKMTVEEGQELIIIEKWGVGRLRNIKQ